MTTRWSFTNWLQYSVYDLIWCDVGEVDIQGPCVPVCVPWCAIISWDGGPGPRHHTVGPHITSQSPNSRHQANISQYCRIPQKYRVGQFDDFYHRQEGWLWGQASDDKHTVKLSCLSDLSDLMRLRLSEEHSFHQTHKPSVTSLPDGPQWALLWNSWLILNGNKGFGSINLSTKSKVYSTRSCTFFWQPHIQSSQALIIFKGELLRCF